MSILWSKAKDRWVFTALFFQLNYGLETFQNKKGGERANKEKRKKSLKEKPWGDDEKGVCPALEGLLIGSAREKSIATGQRGNIESRGKNKDCQ